MILMIGVRFRKSSKVYYFDPTGYEINKGDHVIVETARGLEYGTIVLGPKSVTDDKVVSPLKPLIRVATPEDDKINEENKSKEKEAYQICLEKIKKHQLEMKLIDSEYTFDRNKLLFYFTADGRIDFRELVKDLASVFRTRIELRQIGVRDETKLLGGIAICGRPLCCHSYLSDFAPVSIKMAKEQGLSLNPTQISGVCGRLMCCLKNEQDAYEYLNSSLPAVGAKVKTIDGYVGEVQSTSVLKQLVKVVITKSNGEREIKEYPVADLNFSSNHRSQDFDENNSSLEESLDPQELEQLQMMEQKDLQELAEEDAEKPSGRRDNRRQRNSRPDYSKRDKKDYREGRERRTSRSHGGYENQIPTEGRPERGRYSRPKDEHSRNDKRRGERSRDFSNNQKSQDYNKPKRYNNGSRRSDRGKNHNS
jgi:cell fate regulator YaaT (PSP1 superfamily)